MDFMDWDSYFVFNPKDSRSKIYVEVYDGFVSIMFGNALLEFGCFADSMVGPDSAVLLLRFLLKIRSVRKLDTIVCSGTFLWLFSPAWDAFKLPCKLASSVLSWSFTLPI